MPRAWYCSCGAYNDGTRAACHRCEGDGPMLREPALPQPTPRVVSWWGVGLVLMVLALLLRFGVGRLGSVGEPDTEALPAVVPAAREVSPVTPSQLPRAAIVTPVPSPMPRNWPTGVPYLPNYRYPPHYYSNPPDPRTSYYPGRRPEERKQPLPDFPGLRTD